MSAHQPIDAAAAIPAAIPADAAAAAPDLAAALEAAPFLPSRKTAGWTAMKQRQFLELVALGNTVETSAYMVGLSAQSAYAFRASARGAVFSLGWRAALLLARDRLADTLLARAFEGQKVTITRDDGSEVHRHFYDNRLALAALTRLDRLADADPGAKVPGGIQAARLAAQEWDGFLELVEEERGPARAALFIARRSDLGAGIEGGATLEPIATLARADLRLRTGAGDVAEIDTRDLDVAARAGWSAEQWARAEAAGLLCLAPAPAADLDGKSQPSQHSDGEADDLDALGVWWDEDHEEWRTEFPPRADFAGEEWGEFGDVSYQRTLDDDEEAVVATERALAEAERLGEASAERRARRLAGRGAGRAGGGAGGSGLADGLDGGGGGGHLSVTPAPEPGSRCLLRSVGRERDPGSRPG